MPKNHYLLPLTCHAVFHWHHTGLHRPAQTISFSFGFYFRHIGHYIKGIFRNYKTVKKGSGEIRLNDFPIVVKNYEQERQYRTDSVTPTSTPAKNIYKEVFF